MCHRDFYQICLVKPLKNKRAKTFLNVFIEITNENERKPNKLQIDQGREFYNNLMQKWLDDNDILLYSIHDEGKSVVVERFVKTLKNKIYKKMIVNDEKSYISYLNKLVDEYSNTYHRSIGKNPVDADYSALTDETESSHKSPKFKVVDWARITRYKNVFSNNSTKNQSKEKFVIDSVLKTNPWMCKILLCF